MSKVKFLKIINHLLLSLSILIGSGLHAAEVLDRAKDFTLLSREGKNIRLNEKIGNVVLINFWASWCGPCRQEMPKLENLYQKYKHLGVSIIGVNIDENTELSKNLLNDFPVNFTILYDPEAKVSEPYQVESMPSTYLIDKKGYLRFLHKGYQSGYEDEYDKQIKQLLRE
ncbi:MAG: redoxin [Gammaproteobacteria bacterium CG22_combo_CG10-13_8_21_14_all_40_8]|nr:MAG: redoxin [Gammaproteobacteria bacterium CG22_combo_CG10-13_8_21_14_all_40_8]